MLMADVNGAPAAAANGELDPAGITPADAAATANGDTSKGEESLTNGDGTAVQQESQPAESQPADVAPPTENGMADQTASETPAAASIEPDSRPAVLIIGGLGM